MGRIDERTSTKTVNCRSIMADNGPFVPLYALDSPLNYFYFWRTDSRSSLFFTLAQECAPQTRVVEVQSREKGFER
jgi:hypothetical protein